MARRASELEICFDGMTDLVTNPAGGLILVAVVLLGQIREAPRTPDPRPVGAADKSAADQRPVRPLTEWLNTCTPSWPGSTAPSPPTSGCSRSWARRRPP